MIYLIERSTEVPNEFVPVEAYEEQEDAEFVAAFWNELDPDSTWVVHPIELIPPE